MGVMQDLSHQPSTPNEETLDAKPIRVALEKLWRPPLAAGLELWELEPALGRRLGGFRTSGLGVLGFRV